MRVTWLATLALGLQACATMQHGPTAQEQRHAQALTQVQQAFEKHDSAGIESGLEEARAAAGGEVRLLDEVASVEMAVLIERDDLDTAWRRMTERLAAFVKAKQLDNGLHDEAIFLCEARHDALCAALEADEMLTSALRFENAPEHMKLGIWWQRAHTFRGLAQTLDGANRAAALVYAQRAKDEFNALATKLQQSLPSITILDEQFAALDGDCTTALSKARSLDVATLDPQDAYITAIAFELCGERATGVALRKQILANTELTLFNSVYRYLARH